MSTTRRHLLGATAAAAAAGALAAPALAQTRRLRVVTSWTEDLPILPRSAERLAETLATLSGGRLAMEVVHAGPGRHGAFDVFDMVRQGRADAYHSVEQFWEARHPAYSVFSTVPFGLTAEEMAGWLTRGGGDALWRELAGRFGIHPIEVGNTGHQMGGWFAEKVTSLEALQGRRISAPGIGGRVWAAAGLRTLNLEGPALIPGLLDGSVDAAEWFGPHLDLSIGFMKLLPYYMFPGWQEPSEVLTLGLNAKVHDSLPEADRQILDLAARRESFAVAAEMLVENGRSLNIMRREFGVALEALPTDVIDRLFALTGRVVAEIAGHDALSARIMQSYLGYRDATARYSHISTGRFVSLRNAALGLDEVYTYQ